MASPDVFQKLRCIQCIRNVLKIGFSQHTTGVHIIDKFAIIVLEQINESQVTLEQINESQVTIEQINESQVTMIFLFFFMYAYIHNS